MKNQNVSTGCSHTCGAPARRRKPGANTNKKILSFNSIILASLLFLTCSYAAMAQGKVLRPNVPVNRVPIRKKLPPVQQQQPLWKYVFARTPSSALTTINGGSSNLTIREPFITASVKNNQPIFHIFYHANYVGPTPWKWKVKEIDKLNEVLDFLSYRNTFKNEPLHAQANVVMVVVNGQNAFYIFYVTNDEATSFAKDPWEGYFTNTPENVQAGINQNSVGNDGIPVNELDVNAVD